MTKNSTSQKEEEIQVVSKRCAVTSQRVPAISNPSHIQKPGVARCSISESNEPPTSIKDFHEYVRPFV